MMFAMAGHQCLVEITVTRVEGDGSVLTWSVDTAFVQDPERWTQLAEQAALHMPPPYQAWPGEAVYRIQAGGIAAMIGERHLEGPLRDLTEAVLAETSSGAADG